MDTGSLYGGLSLSNADLNKIGRTKWNGGSKQERDVDDSKGTAPVGRYVPNPWGLYDMIGQVWELCRDTLAAQPTGTSESQTDPIAQGQNGTGTLVPQRGASWDNKNALSVGHHRANYRAIGSYMNENPNGGQTALQSGYRISFTEQ
jgi:formylglycine-generating enzyme required for sulfatase activity